MLKVVLFIFICNIFFSCFSSPPPSRIVSKDDLLKLELKYRYDTLITDSTYGYSEHNPIKAAFHQDTCALMGPFTEYYYLSHLTTADGRKIDYRRLGSCCKYPSKYAVAGDSVPLDKYEIISKIIADNSTEKDIIYINMYDSGKVYAPVGYRLNKIEPQNNEKPKQ